MRPTAAAATDGLGTFTMSAMGTASASASAATSTLTTAATPTAIRTTARARPGSPLPTSIATRRTEAMSIPKRVAAPTTNASCVIRVI